MEHVQGDEPLEQVVEPVLERMGLELVDLERAGHKARPILRLRIDRPGSEAGHGVTVEECAEASRALEEVLDAQADRLPSYILEVSSPGVERPLSKRRDFERYVGREICVRGFLPLARGSKRIEGVLLGIEGTGDDERVRMKLADDDTEIEVSRSRIARANLIVKWEEFGRSEGSKQSL